MIDVRSVRVFIAILVFGCCFADEAQAQGTASDYQRAEGFRKKTSNKVFKTKVEPKIPPRSATDPNDASEPRRLLHDGFIREESGE